jgi:hypothetical protein
MSELDLPLDDGTMVNVQVIKDGNGNPRYIIQSKNRSFDTFVWSPHSTAIESDPLHPSQKIALSQIVNKIPK